MLSQIIRDIDFAKGVGKILTLGSQRIPEDSCECFNRTKDSGVMENIRPPGKSDFGPKAESFKGHVLDVSQALDPIESCPPPHNMGSTLHH
ncbi:hypothetical protein TNCV_3445641 [Trichonephila clavipes]|nr:hypothetical protein TNCV_3445641 [Trichonephila clavipes]